MNDWNHTIIQIQQFVSHHVQDTALSRPGLGSALAVVLAGIICCVLGAKLARVGLIGAWVAGGALVGAAMAKEIGFHPLPAALLFAAGLGVIGHLTYRMLVGAITAAVITVGVFSVFAYQRVGPYVEGYNNEHTPLVAVTREEGAATIVPVSAEGEDVNVTDDFLPSPDRQASNRREAFTLAFTQPLKDLWGYAAKEDVRLTSHGKALGFTALIFGLLLGLVGMARYAMILDTAIIGTVLFGVGAIGALGLFAPTASQAALNSPIILGIVLSVCAIASMILQFRLTRPHSDKGESQAKTA